ncbi:MAG: glycoside hydrolase TIM-barrel-like domain-containing protein, partial [Pseudomonadota bacterium]
EYFGFQPGDGSGDVFFHLDPLWADGDCDFVGIDNYLPIADWRHSAGHVDGEDAASVYSLPYLKGNVCGGEGFDWYYANTAARESQTRTPIDDTAHGEHWVFRPKDLVNWWSQPHHNRPGGARNPSPTDWVPQSKPIWFTELGCPAVDLGANQPNVFVDPKSSESFLPYFSQGARDDYMQRRYIQAVLSHWEEAGANPTSQVYGGPMLDLDRAFIWTWDARPWPDFPARLNTWSDGVNHELGHWITGRLGAAPLPAVVADICLDAGVEAFDVNALYGVVDGVAYGSNETPRERLQSLMLVYGFDCVESEGVLKFRHRDGAPERVLSRDEAALTRESGRALELTRQPEGDMPRAVRLSYVDAERDYETGASEAQSAEPTSTRVERSSAPVALTAGKAQQVTDRWLAEAVVAREGATFTACRASLALESGDIISLEDAPGDARYRIDRVEELGRRELALTRVEPASHTPVARTLAAPTPKPAAVAAKPLFEFMDLPLIGGAVSGQPRIAAFADPWTSAARVYLASGAEDFAPVAAAQTPAVMGELAEDLTASSPDRWSRDGGVEVAIYGGGLSSHDVQSVLNGANTAALKTPGGTWEVFQFLDAELVAEGRYRLSRLLRGQVGTEAFIAPVTAAGSRIVLLNGAAARFDLDSSLRGLELSYRVRPTHKSHTHESFAAFSAQFDDVALRPWAPAHIRAETGAAGVETSWVRRARVEGDTWDGFDVPLAEDREAYRVRISQGAVLREVEVGSPAYLYTAADISADGASGAIEIAVSQISQRFGYGPEAKVMVNV